MGSGAFGTHLASRRKICHNAFIRSFVLAIDVRTHGRPRPDPRQRHIRRPEPRTRRNLRGDRRLDRRSRRPVHARGRARRGKKPALSGGRGPRPGAGRARRLGPVLGARRRAALLALGAGFAGARPERRARGAWALGGTWRGRDRPDRPRAEATHGRRAGIAEFDARPAGTGAVPAFRIRDRFSRRGGGNPAVADRAGRPAYRRSGVAADAGRVFATGAGHARHGDRDLPRSGNEAGARTCRADRPGREGRRRVPAARPR